MRSTLAFVCAVAASVALVAAEPHLVAQQQNTAALHRRHHHAASLERRDALPAAGPAGAGGAAPVAAPHKKPHKKGGKKKKHHGGKKSKHQRSKCSVAKTNKVAVANGQAAIASNVQGLASAANSTAKNVESAASNVVSAALSAISAFKGTPNSGIGSWYRANNGGDSTNGHSWCYFPYTDNSLVFAPSFKQMVSNFGGDPIAAGKAYCGLEAKVTNPSNGKSMLLYIGDAFDDTWVRTPQSIDIMTGAFNQLFGSSTSNKNDVIQNIQWQLTGNRSPQYTFSGPGN